VLSHAVARPEETIFDGVADAGEAFQIGRIEAEEVRLSRRLDHEAIGKAEHRRSPRRVNAGRFQDGMTGSVGTSFEP